MYTHVKVVCCVADLARMYTLVSRLAEDRGRDELQDRFEAHVHSQGVAAVEKCGESAQNVCEQDKIFNIYRPSNLCTVFDSFTGLVKSQASNFSQPSKI